MIFKKKYKGSENLRFFLKQNDLLDEAETICNRIVLINKGKIMADGTCSDILKQTKTKSLEKAFAKLTCSNE